MDEKLQRLFRELGLENTRLLVKGIDRLHLGYHRTLQQRESGGKGDWQLDALQEFVREAYRSSLSDNQYLAQNPYAELWKFRLPKPDTEWMEKTDSLRLSGMILLYHQLQTLEELPSDQLAEAYETLCNGIRCILEADMCYLVSRHLTDTRMLCSSSVRETDLDTQLGGKEAGELLDKLNESEKYFQPTEGIFLKNKREKAAGQKDWWKADTLILPIRLYDKKGEPFDQQAFLICQRRKKALWRDNLRQTLLQVRDTLFLRGQLAQALVRDLANLLSMAREFRSIRRKGQDQNVLRILHISDLHVTQKNCENLKNCIKALGPGPGVEFSSFDFLVITGDVIQGRYAAGDLETHYDCAAEVIRALAFRMWGESLNGEMVLRQDWKRRTIILPGNHDYASMNELETQRGETHRASGGGKPATREGSAMAKFTYYINFVRKLLDVDIGDLIDNSLNELRRYDEMGVTFLCCNTSIMANPARNNKVHLDEDFVRRAIYQLSSEEEQTVIFLGHHGPDYEIDYVSDEYLEPLVCKQITQNLAAAIQKPTDGKKRGAIRKLVKSMKRLDPPPSRDILDSSFVQAWLLHDNIKELPPDIKKRVVARRMDTRLYRQLTFLFEQLKKTEAERNINERYQKILAEIRRAMLLTEKDSAAYDSVFELLERELKPCVCLSGHTHDWNLNRKDHHYTAKRFYSEEMRRVGGSSKLQREGSLNYGICEIRKGAPDPILYESVESPCQ